MRNSSLWIIAAALAASGFDAHCQETDNDGGQANTATTDAKSKENKERIDRLNEEKEYYEAVKAANKAKSEAVFGESPTVDKIRGSIEVTKESAAIAEWASFYALDRASALVATQIAQTTTGKSCKTFIPLAWGKVADSKARSALLDSMAAQSLRLLSPTTATGTRTNSTALGGWASLATSATAWAADLLGYFHSDLKTAFSPSENTKNAAMPMVMGHLAAIQSTSTHSIFVEYPTLIDIQTAEAKITPLLDQLDKAKNSDDKELVAQVLDLIDKKISLISSTAKDYAVIRHVDNAAEQMCMVDVNLDSSLSATTLSTNLFRTPRTYDRGSASLRWEVVGQDGRLLSSGVKTSICEADAKLTHKVKTIKPQCYDVPSPSSGPEPITQAILSTPSDQSSKPTFGANLDLKIHAPDQGVIAARLTTSC